MMEPECWCNQSRWDRSSPGSRSLDWFAFVFVAAFTAFASRRVGTEQAIEEARRVAYVRFGSVSIGPVLDDDLIRTRWMSGRSIGSTLWCGNRCLRGSLVRVKVWSEDGTIVYSDESRLIGEQFTLGDDERAIFTSGDQGAEVSDLSKPENRYETESKLLEVYSLTETPSGTPLLFEAYFRYSGVTDVGRHLWAQLAITK